MNSNLSIHDLSGRSTGTQTVLPIPFALSIHDLSGRSTLANSSVTIFPFLSIHDLSGRSTYRNIRIGGLISLSIHDLSGRSTISPIRRLIEEIFQFTTSRGGRQNSIHCVGSLKPFNSRPLGEVDLALSCPSTPTV